MVESTNGGRLKELRFNEDFRTISPNEYVQEGTLVWVERFSDEYYNVEVEGPLLSKEDGGLFGLGLRTKIIHRLEHTLNSYLLLQAKFGL